MNHLKGERKMKRLTVAAIIAVMAAGVFTGCGNRGTAQMNSATGNTADSRNSGAVNSVQGDDQEAAGTENDVQSGGQNMTGTGGQTDADPGARDIGEDAALKAALEAAGVNEADASRIRVSLDRDDGRTVYDVSFDVGQTEYDYEVLASDGRVVSSDVEQRDDDRYDCDGRNRRKNADVAVSCEEAADIALAKVPGATENDIRIELDHDDGRYKYEGDIIYERVEYEFEIDADSGEVISWGEERS